MVPSVLPQAMTKYTQAVGKADLTTGEVTISKDWYLLLLQLYTYTVGAGFTTAEAALLESGQVDEPPILSFNGLTGAQTATFTATNKPGTGTSAPVAWIAVNYGGKIGYVPVFA